MPKQRKTSLVLLSIAIFILLEIVSFCMLRNNGELQGIWAARMSHSVMAKAWGGSENLRHYLSLNKENEILANENARLNQILGQYQAIEAQKRSDSLTAAIPHATGDYVYSPATIIKISRNKQHNYFIINKGLEDGIRPQSGIITNNGVIGIIDAVD